MHVVRVMVRRYRIQPPRVLMEMNLCCCSVRVGLMAREGHGIFSNGRTLLLRSVEDLLPLATLLLLQLLQLLLLLLLQLLQLSRLLLLL